MDTNKIILYSLIIGCLVLLYLICNKKNSPSIENFASVKVFDKPKGIYGNFYSKIYDELFFSPVKTNYEANEIKNYTFKKYKKNDIRIADIGCGTGQTCKHFDKAGYKTTGLDQSKHMLKKAQQNTVSVDLVKGDFMNPNALPKNKFTHITALFFTVYYTDDVDKFFRNCNGWLKQKGFLCVHLINKKKFDPVLERSSSLLPLFDPQKYSKKRRTKTELTFDKFKYNSDWNFAKTPVKFVEQFTVNSISARKHEHTLHIKPIKVYKKAAIKNGFKLFKIIDLTITGHNDNYVYCFQKKF
jgi:SAM-dependent methyltransferase